MNKFAFGAALTVLAAALPTAAPAQRLSPAVVAMVDAQRVLNECTACKAAAAQIQQQVQQVQQRAQQLGQPMETEQKALEQAIQALNGKQPDAALTQRLQAFQDKQNSARQELAGRQQTLQSTQAHVNQQIGQRLGPILNQVMQARGATVILDKANTLAAAASIDVTNDVLAQLNQQLPSVSVTPMPQQQPQQQPQGR